MYIKMITKEQIETPCLLIDLDILESNIRTMTEFFSDKKAKLKPHFKTFKCITIAHKLIKAGAKGISCAKLGEAETLVNSGIRDVLIANQIVDRDKVFRLAGLAHGDSKVSVAVDNEENIHRLSEAASMLGSTIYVLVEVDVGMKRCGVNSAEEVLRLVNLISGSKGLVFEGIQAYEGHLVHIPEYQKRLDGTKDVIEKITSVKKFLEKAGVRINEISGGGTGTYNMTGDNTIWTEIQAGSFVFMDTDYNSLSLPFKNALTVLAQVIHKRLGFAVTDAGLKVCSPDGGVSLVKGHPDSRLVLNEEHGNITDERDELKYLQKIEYIPSHCCSTVNLHDQYYCVRNNMLEAIWPISARGKSK
jgi:D-serine deaminase-like pyridoxal phosphate-dependent protein